MTSEHQFISRKDEGDRVIIFERGDLVFVFNFHWTSSYFDYRIGCSKPGKYKVCPSTLLYSGLLCFHLCLRLSLLSFYVSTFQIVLDSDDPLFGGFGRLDRKAEYFTYVRKIK